VPVVPRFDDYSDEEQQSPTSQFDDQRSSQPVYDSYESDSELDMQDFQEHTTEPYPLFIKEKYYEEINHPGPAEDTESRLKRKLSHGSCL
jgi:alpha-galactosidase/6-phospho-beta-glucosidase family protein